MNSQDETKYVHLRPHVKQFAIGAGFFWLIALLFYNFFIKEPAYNQIVTSNNTLQKNLEDSSMVFLNYNTVLAVPESFTYKERKVKIDGEGYFSAKMQKERPFLVLVNDLKLSTFGAEFNVKIENGNIIVTVAEGKVKVEKSEDEFVILHYGQEVTFDKNAYTFYRNIRADKNIYAYYTKKFEFKNYDLNNAIYVLSSAFHKNIVVENEDILDQTFTKNFENEDLNTILDKITKELNINYRVDPNQYTLYKKQ